MISLSKVMQASRRLLGVVENTSFVRSGSLSLKTKTDVYLKNENLQITGSYKIRGAYNKISLLNDKERSRGVVASSAGNHAQGVAYSAKKFKIASTIVMPLSTPLIKIENTKSLGASIILYGDTYDESYKYGLNYAKEHNLTFIHPFEDEDVITGQGTIALEMLEIIPDLDLILAPIGGGGLISGIACAAKQINKNIKVVGVTAKGAPSMYRSYKDKTICNPTSIKTIADGVAVKKASAVTFDIILKHVDDILQVDDEEIASAILFLIEEQKIVVEGGGALTIASLLHKKIDMSKYNKVGAIISGGNIDVQMLSLIIEKGMLKTHRKLKLIITLIDKPGSLERLTEIFLSEGGNIVHIDYDRVSTSLSYGDANIIITIETKGKKHQNNIKEKLLKNGYLFKVLD